MPSTWHLQGASQGLLAPADDNTSFSTAPSRFGQSFGGATGQSFGTATGHSIGGTNSRPVFQESLSETHQDSHGLYPIAQESSFADDAHRKPGMDGYGHRTTESYIDQHDSYAYRGNTSRLSGTSQRLSRTAAGGGSSFAASFSRFMCCGAPSAQWDSALAHAVPSGQCSPDEARSARMAQLSAAQRSTSAPARSVSIKLERAGSVPPKPPKHSKLPVATQEVGMFSEGESDPGEEGGPMMNEGWSSQRSAHSIHRPSSAATVVAPSTPNAVRVASPHRQGAAGGAAGTPKSARGCARGAFESPDATPKPPRSQSRTNRSGDNSVSRHGSQREPMSTPEQSPQSFNIRKLSQSEQSPYAPMPSPRSDRQHLNLSSNPSFKERTPGTPPVPPSPHGSLKERRRESSKKEKGCDDQNVYFFTSGLVSDSEADNSNVFGAAGASNKMDAILSSTPKAVVGVTQFTPTGYDGVAAPRSVPSAMEPGYAAQDRHKFLMSESNVSAPDMNQSGSAHTPRRRGSAAAHASAVDDTPSYQSSSRSGRGGTPRAGGTPRSIAAPAASVGGAAAAAAATTVAPTSQREHARTPKSPHSRHPTPPESQHDPHSYQAAKQLQPHSHSSFASSAVPHLDSAAIHAAGSQLAPVDTFQVDTFHSVVSGVGAPSTAGTFAATVNNAAPFQRLEGSTADYNTAYTAKYGEAPPRTSRSHQPEDDSHMRDNDNQHEETSTAFYNESALESSMLQDMHDTHPAAQNDPEEEEDSDDDWECRKPKNMDPIDALDWQLDRLCDKLDGICERGEKVLGRYILDGADGRRQGGQAVVQFARNVRDGYPYAIKFYVSKSAFEAEKKLYRHQVLAPMLPHMAESSDGGHVASGGTGQLPTKKHKLPPFIIVEKGEALDEFVQRAQPDMYQSVAILANISKRLVQLHNAGYVHRDLKPSNFLWLPRQNRWTIIDFGSVAKMKQPVEMSFSLRYAAPEVVDAVHRGDRKIIPEASQDVWSLGVTAFELLTGKPAFELATDDTQEVLQQLIGDEELPWEGGRAATGKYMRKLRGLRGPVLKLLNRTPCLRPSMSQFCQMCDSIFSTRTDIRTPRDPSPGVAAAPAVLAPPASGGKCAAPRAATAAPAAATAPTAPPASSARKAASGGSDNVSGRRKQDSAKSGDSRSKESKAHSKESKESRRQSRVEALYGSPDDSDNNPDPEPEAPKSKPTQRPKSGSASGDASQAHGRSKVSARAAPSTNKQPESRASRAATPAAAGTDSAHLFDNQRNPTEVSTLSYDGDVDVSEALSPNLLSKHSAQRAARRAAKAKSQKKRSDPHSAAKPSRESSTPKSLRTPANHAELSPGMGPEKTPSAPKKLSAHRSMQRSDDRKHQDHPGSSVSVLSENPLANRSKPGGSESLRLLRDAVPSGGAAGGEHASSDYTAPKAPVSLGARSERQSTCQSDRCSFLRTPSASNRPVSGGIPSNSPLATPQRDSLSPEHHALGRAASGASAGGVDNALHTSYTTDTDVAVTGRNKLLMRSMHTRGESSREGASLSRVADSRQDSLHDAHALDVGRSSSVDPFTNSQNEGGLGWVSGAAHASGSHSQRTASEQEERKRSTRSGGKYHDKVSKHSAHMSSSDRKHSASARASVAPSSMQSQRSMHGAARADHESLPGDLPDECSAQNAPEKAPVALQAPHRSSRSNDKEPSPRPHHQSHAVSDEKQSKLEERAARHAARAARAARAAAPVPAADGHSSRSISNAVKGSRKVSGANQESSGRHHSEHSSTSARNAAHGNELSARSQKSVFIDEMFSLPRGSSGNPGAMHDDGGSIDAASGPYTGSSSRRVHGASSRRVHKDRTPSAAHGTPSSPTPKSLPQQDLQGGGQKPPVHGGSRKESSTHGAHASDGRRHRSGGSSRSAAQKEREKQSSSSRASRHISANPGQNDVESTSAEAKPSRHASVPSSRSRRSHKHAESVPECSRHASAGGAVYSTLGGNESSQFETVTSHLGQNDLEGSQARQRMESMHSKSHSRRSAPRPSSNVSAKISQFETPESSVHGQHASHSSTHGSKSRAQHKSGGSRSSKGATPPTSSRGSAVGESSMHGRGARNNLESSNAGYAHASQDDNPVWTWMQSRAHASSATLGADESSMM